MVRITAPVIRSSHLPAAAGENQWWFLPAPKPGNLALFTRGGALGQCR